MLQSRFCSQAVSKQNSLGNGIFFFFLKQQQQNPSMLRGALEVISYQLPCALQMETWTLFLPGEFSLFTSRDVSCLWWPYAFEGGLLSECSHFSANYHHLQDLQHGSIFTASFSLKGRWSLGHILPISSQEHICADGEHPYFISVELILAWMSCSVNKRTHPPALVGIKAELLCYFFCCIKIWSFFKTKKKITHRKKAFPCWRAVQVAIQQVSSSTTGNNLPIHNLHLRFKGENSDAASIFLAIRSSLRMRFLFNKTLFLGFLVLSRPSSLVSS